MSKRMKFAYVFCLLAGLAMVSGPFQISLIAAFLSRKEAGNRIIALAPWTIPSGIILVAFSIAIKRAGEGGKTKNPFRALTPAQIVLISSMALWLVAQLLITVWESNSLTRFLYVLGSLGSFGALILALTAARKKSAAQAARTVSSVAGTAPAARTVASVARTAPVRPSKPAVNTARNLTSVQPSAKVPNAVPQPVSTKGSPKKCEKCGVDLARFSNSSVSIIDGYRFCPNCSASARAFLDSRNAERKGLLERIPHAKSDLVTVLNMILAKRQYEEEQERLKVYRIYHTKCSICGTEHPKSDLFIIDNKYYCAQCFEEQFAFGSYPGANSAAKADEKEPRDGEAIDVWPADRGTVDGGFDRDGFVKKYSKVIAPRLPDNIDDAETQKNLLENLEKVMYAAGAGYVSIVSDWELSLSEKTPDKLSGLIRQTAGKLEEKLSGWTAFRLSPAWDTVSREQIIDAFILLDYYAYLLGTVNSANIRSMMACIAGQCAGQC